MSNEAIREKSDPRSTLNKVKDLGDTLGELGMILDDKVVHDYEGVAGLLGEMYDLVAKIEVEVDVMTKCQYEMRKTIKEKTYSTVIDARRDQSGGLQDGTDKK